MNCLAILGRELRVAARKRGTFWLRVAAALTALIVGLCCLLLSSLQGTGTAGMGTVLFHALTWIGLGAGSCAGLFFTSDCLSEEKREGTLGLLFLTDLRGYDVVLGKLLATSLRGLYALLAVLPILAVTQLMGGVSGAQYWKSSLALLNALFCSLAAGMLVSAISRDSQKALAATLLILLLFSLGGPLVDAILAKAGRRGFQLFWTLSSPGYVLLSASAWGRSAYWPALFTTHLLGWGMFVAACVLVPHTWRERKNRDAGVNRGLAYTWKYGGQWRRARLRRRLLEVQPIAWLVCREVWQSLGLWTLALLATGGLVLLLIKLPMEGWITWNYVSGLLTLVLYLGAASQATRFMAEARRAGFLELLLVSPVGEKRIVRGQWRALLGLFGLPVLLFVGIHVIGAGLSQRSMVRLASRVATGPSSTVTNQISGASQTVVVGTSAPISGTPPTNAAPTPGFSAVGSPTRQMLLAVSYAGAAAAKTIANLLAICWFGMWMGLSSRTANLATLKTIVFVQVIPWFAITFGTTMVIGLFMAQMFARMSATSPSWWITWWPLLNALLGTVLALGKDIGFIVWSRNRLDNNFRQQAAGISAHRRPRCPRF